MDDITRRCVEIRKAIGITDSTWIGTEFELIGCALEAVMTDEATREAGLWQGDLIPRALDNLRRLVAQYRPIPLSERLPGKGQRVLAYWSEHDLWTTAYWNGDYWDDNEIETTVFNSEEITHWLPLPPNPTDLQRHLQ